MIGVAAGMCHEGLSPVVITYAPFVTGRVFDQIKSAVGEMGLPLGLVGSNAGLSKGDLGALLMCTDDVALMRTIPGMTILSPADGVELVKSLTAAVLAGRPFYLRMTGGKTLPAVYAGDYDLVIGKAVPMRSGSRVLVIASGAVMTQVLSAADRMEREGCAVSVLNMHTVKPLDTDAIERYMDHDVIVTVEEHSVHGGLGSAVAEYLAPKPRHPALVSIGTPDSYYKADHYESLLLQAGLAAGPLYRTIRKLYDRTER